MLKRTVKNLAKSPWKILLIILVISLFAVRIGQKKKNAEAPLLETKPKVHSLISTLADADGFMNLTCRVEAAVDIEITPEASGSVTSVSIKDGDTVRRGQTLFVLENLSERISMQDAKVALESAKLSLEELVSDSGENGSLVLQTKKQQEAIAASAKNSLLNNDLLAYPENNPQGTDESGPTVSGNYTCAAEGDYIVDVYASGSDSGASFRVRGLETGTSSVSTAAFGTALGTCGLELSFTEGFDKNQTWVIPVPNVRSSSYTTVMKSYEATLETKNLSIDQVSASDQQIKQKQSQIDQANLRYQLAADTYSKTIVKAKSAGTISSFTLDKGDFVSTGVSTGSLKTSDDLELVTYVSPSEKAFISTLSQANVEDFQTTIKTISGSIDSKTKKTRITLEDPSELELLEGTQLGCTIARIQPTAVVVGGGIIVPLSAISVIGTQPHVFTLDQKNIAVAQPVDLGAILGNTIVTYGIVSDSIVSDARGITSGDLIEVKE